MKNAIEMIKSILGDDFFEELSKSEIGSGIFKPDTNTTVDPSEIKIALEITPKVILSFLISHLKPLEVGGNLDLKLPFIPNTNRSESYTFPTLHVNKISTDVYTGDIVHLGKRITEFKYRSLPGVGLILMSTFELYDMDDLQNIKQDEPKVSDSKLQDMIDERLKLHSLVRNVVDQRISERDAIQQLINERLSEQFDDEEYEDEEYEDEDEDEGPLHSEEEASVEILEDSEEDIMNASAKKSKLKDFLDSKEKKRQEKVELDKSEIDCTHCGTSLYKGEDSFTLCVCFGQFHNKEIKITKAEDGKFSLKFPKSFDIDNVELLLSSIRRE